jgi:hypothetical protein
LPAMRTPYPVGSVMKPERREAEEQEAQSYAEALYKPYHDTDWLGWNRRIITRWSVTALMRIKRRAWAIVESER